MKKILFSYTLIFCSCIALMAEEHSSIGLKLGMVETWVNHSGEYPQYEKTVPKVSSQISVFKTFSLTSQMSLQISIEWLQQTTEAKIIDSQLSGGDSVEPLYRRTKSYFIALPLLCQYKINSFFLSAGPTVAYLVNSQYEHYQKIDSRPVWNPKRWWGYDITDQQNALHLSLRAGIGKVVTLFHSPSTIEIYYWNDFTNFSYREDKWTEQGIMLTFGLFL